jgi:hypothetical protein
VRVLPRPETMFGNLQYMTRASDVVAVGSVTSCKTIEMGTSVGTILGTRYELVVTRMLKGEPVKSDRLDVDYPGGRRESTAAIGSETRVAAFRPPQIGDVLVGFLKRGPSANALSLGSEFVLFPNFSSGLMSSFCLAPDGLVQPSYHGGSEGLTL